MKRVPFNPESHSRLTEVEPGTWKPMKKSRPLPPMLKLALAFAAMSIGILLFFFGASKLLIHSTKPSPKQTETRIQ